MLERHGSNAAVKGRVLGFAALAVVFATADRARACDTPRKLAFRGKSALEGGGSLELRGIVEERGTRFQVRGRDLDDPVDAYHVVLLSTPHDLDLGSLERGEHDGWILRFESHEDLRELALAVEGFALFDGDAELFRDDLRAALSLTLASRLRLEGEHGGSKFELGARFTRASDGSATFEVRASARGAAPGSYVLTLLGGDGEPLRVPLEVDGRLARTRLTGDDDRCDDALRWTQMTVTLDDHEIGSAEIACR